VFLAELGEPVKVTGTDNVVIRLIFGVLLYLQGVLVRFKLSL